MVSERNRKKPNGGKVTIGKSLSLYADVYDPYGSAKMDKESNLYGALIAKSLKVNTDAALHYDESLWSRTAGRFLWWK